MKNNQLEVLTNITHDITNQFSLKRIDEDVLFLSIIGSSFDSNIFRIV